MSVKAMLTPKQLAEVLGVHYDTAQRMLRRRQIRFVQIGKSPRNRRVPVEEVQRWIDAQLAIHAAPRPRAKDRRSK